MDFPDQCRQSAPRLRAPRSRAVRRACPAGTCGTPWCHARGVFARLPLISAAGTGLQPGVLAEGARNPGRLGLPAKRG